MAENYMNDTTVLTLVTSIRPLCSAFGHPVVLISTVNRSRSERQGRPAATSICKCMHWHSASYGGMRCLYAAPQVVPECQGLHLMVMQCTLVPLMAVVVSAMTLDAPECTALDVGVTQRLKRRRP